MTISVNTIDGHGPIILAGSPFKVLTAVRHASRTALGGA
jgi:hypothetical protein